jgi:hypothetical protein
VVESLSGPFAILVLVLDILAIVQVWRSSIEVGRKVIWALVIVLLPGGGRIMGAVAAGPCGKARL